VVENRGGFWVSRGDGVEESPVPSGSGAVIVGASRREGAGLGRLAMESQ
jgi:hypothetical protein